MPNHSTHSYRKSQENRQAKYNVYDNIFHGFFPYLVNSMSERDTFAIPPTHQCISIQYKHRE